MQSRGSGGTDVFIDVPAGARLHRVPPSGPILNNLPLPLNYSAEIPRLFAIASRTSLCLVLNILPVPPPAKPHYMAFRLYIGTSKDNTDPDVSLPIKADPLSNHLHSQNRLLVRLRAHKLNPHIINRSVGHGNRRSRK